MRRIFPLSGRMRNARRGMRIPGLPSAPIGDVVRPVRLLAGRSPKACDSAGEGAVVPLSPPLLYTQLHRRIRAQFSGRHLFPPTIITHRTSLHLIHLFFFEISYEWEYRRWKPLIVFERFCLAVWLMSVGRELFKWI